MKENEARVIVTMAVPFDPKKRPKAPAIKLPSKDNDTVGKYVLNESFLSCFWYSWQFAKFDIISDKKRQFIHTSHREL